MADKFTFHNFFEELEKATNNFKKINILKNNDNPEVRAFFVLAYHPNVQWLIPEGAPPYKPNESFMEGSGYFNMVKNMKNFNMFLKGRGFDNMQQIQRENRFINMLESVTPLEAKYIIMAKDRKIKTVSLKTVNSVFENLIPVNEAK